MSPQETATAIRDAMPPGGLFAGLQWRISPAPFPLDPHLAKEIESLGRVLLQFYRVVNLLYRRSVEGKQPEWIARWLDLGKPADLIALQRSSAFKNDVPRVIRPDILLTENGFGITELDSVPGGIGLTAWLNSTYGKLDESLSLPHGSELSSSGSHSIAVPSPLPSDGRGEVRVRNAWHIIGGADGMIRGFESIFGKAKNVHLVVSEEAATYRPEMEWLAQQIKGSEFKVQDSKFSDFKDGDAVYRFFELFDLPNISSAKKIFEMASEKKITLTPPPKPLFEEKMLFALLWNGNLRDFWRQELGEGFFARLKKIIPYTWLVDPAPMPPQAAIPGLDLTDWQQLKTLSQRDRELILKVSGFSEKAWGARGVFFGSDLPQAEWVAAVDEAIASFEKSPFVLQRYEKPRLVEASWFDFEKNETIPMKGRARLCPYYFVSGEGDAARPQLGGILATIVPADKKIIHGMTEAVLAPCMIGAS
jgi:hypothetical protein